MSSRRQFINLPFLASEPVLKHLEMTLGNSGDPILVYLDQNVFSGLQKGKVQRESLRDILTAMSSNGALFVYSATHVEECQASNQPKDFAEIIEGVSAHYLEQPGATDPTIILSPQRAEELILAEHDIAREAGRRMKDLLKPMQFAMGWLGEVEAKTLQDELLDGFRELWKLLEDELPSEMHPYLPYGKDEICKLIKEMPLDRVKEESHEWRARFRDCLPQNFAQLDAVPDNEVVEYIFSRLEQKEQVEIRNIYPRGFWADIRTREEGRITGFAFLLYIMGIVRDRRVERRDRARREKHFLGQFQDCQHIEAATRCSMFVTFDRGAARLAKAVYAYAGVGTAVVHLKAPES